MKTRPQIGTAGGAIMAEHQLGERDIEVLVWAEANKLCLEPKAALEFAEQLASLAKRALERSKK